MRLLTREVLSDNGFKSDWPDRSITKFVKADPEYEIEVAYTYGFTTHSMIAVATCKKLDKKTHVVTKEARVSPVETVDELQMALKLCGINIYIED